VSQYLLEMEQPDAGMLFAPTSTPTSTTSTGPTEHPVSLPAWGVPPLFAGSSSSSSSSSSSNSGGLGMRATILSLAPTRVGLPFHNHGSAWETVIAGKKLILFIPPLQAPIPAEALSLLEQAALFVGSSLEFIKQHYSSTVARVVPTWVFYAVWWFQWGGVALVGIECHVGWFDCGSIIACDLLPLGGVQPFLLVDG
jgi:hypothetical protein